MPDLTLTNNLQVRQRPVELKRSASVAMAAWKARIHQPSAPQGRYVLSGGAATDR